EVGVLLAQLGPEASHVDVDRARPAEVLVAPDPAEQDLAGEDLARVRGQEPEQLVLHVGEIERTAFDGGLVGLEVEGQGAVLDELGPSSATAAHEQVLEARTELGRTERRHAEVVEEVL